MYIRSASLQDYLVRQMHYIQGLIILPWYPIEGTTCSKSQKACYQNSNKATTGK